MATPPIPAPDVVNLLNDVLDAATLRHSNGDETFIECRLCGEWDGHTDACPLPTIEGWLEGPP
jgi:hypothetical protein